MSRKNIVNIRGLPLKEVVKALWANGSPAIAFAQAGESPPSLDESEIDWVLNSSCPCFDYLSGRAIKTCFKGTEEFNASNYNRYYPERPAQVVIERLRREFANCKN